MNAKTLQLFQVLTNWQEKPLRFHMQVNKGNSEFSITDKDKLPKEIIALEQALGKAILQKHH